MAIAVPIKLVRALWIIPVCIGYAALRGVETANHKRAKLSLPWFLLWFLLAATVATFLPTWLPQLHLEQFQPTLHTAFATLTTLGKSGLAVTLFLIGSSLNRKALARVGVRPLLQAVLLWIVSASASLFAIQKGWIG
jgi:uncharacterized membrane protein YadS